MLGHLGAPLGGGGGGGEGGKGDGRSAGGTTLTLQPTNLARFLHNLAKHVLVR